MAENIINRFLQLNDPNIARQTRNMSYFDALKSEIPGTKSYQGYNPFYKGADKTGLRGYVNQGIKSLGGSFQQGSNVGGATPLTRKLAQDATRLGSKVANLGRFALNSPFGAASAVGTGIGYGVDAIARATNTPEEYEAMKEAARAQGGFGYFDDVDISQPPGTDVGIMGNLRNLFSSSAMANEPVVNVDNVKSAINASRNREALNKAGLMALDDAGLTTPAYEEFAEVNKPGFNFNRAGNFLTDLKDKGIEMFGSGKNLALRGIGSIIGGPVGGFIGGALGNLTDQFENRPLGANVIDEFGNTFDFNELNKQNALGGYYTDPARSARRRSRRIAKMLERQNLGKKISLKKLAELQAQEKAQEALQQAATNRMQAENRAAGIGGYQAGYDSGFMEGPSGAGSGMGAADKGGSDTMGSS